MTRLVKLQYAVRGDESRAAGNQHQITHCGLPVGSARLWIERVSFAIIIRANP
jgi:hypothetical protein